jgi:ABC-type enterochelin transport system substrate-binding protein
MADALEIATFLKQTYDVRVMGVGSLFDPDLAFRETSDIDLVVVGMPAGSFFEASAKAAKMTAFKLDVIPLEDATEYMREVALSGGTEL